MSTLRIGALIAAGTLLVTQQVRAEGWLTGWLPGSKSESTTTKTSETRTPMLGSKPVRSTSKTAATQDPSLWQRMTNGTKALATGTKNALGMGGSDEKPKGKHTSWDDPPTARINKKTKEQPSMWSRLFKPEEPHPSKTVHDFLSQERPEQAH